MLMTSADNPLGNKQSVTIAEIAEHPLIFPKTGFTRHMLDKLFRPYSSRLRVTMELPSVGMIKSFVAAGLGVSLISETFVKEEVRAGAVRVVEIADAELKRQLGLIYRRDRSLPRAASAFITLIRERAAKAAPAL
jgi:DNA-binding transcriptional LysR family regulator